MNVSFSLQTNPQGKHQNDSHFAEGDTEAQRVNEGVKTWAWAPHHPARAKHWTQQTADGSQQRGTLGWHKAAKNWQSIRGQAPRRGQQAQTLS